MIRAALILSAAAVCGAAAASAQEPAKVAGTDVPAPKRTRFVAPAYPAEAQARGQRGIVILEIVVDEEGKVASADVIRSVPPFDEAALAAARQWEYEVTKVDGQPVRVRVTVPITFALKLPEMTREEGVPEMRQGAVPGFPPGLDGPARVVADVTLMPDGSVGEATVKSGDSPWSEGLLLAMRTWRFAPPPAGTQVAFTVQADFVSAARPGQPPRIDLKLSAPVKTAAAEAPAPAGAAAVDPPAPAAPAAADKAPEPAVTPAPAPAAVPPASDPPPQANPAAGPAPGSAAAPGPSPEPAATPEPPPSRAPEPMTETVMPSAAATPAPPVEEIIPAPDAPAAPTPPPPQPGFSAVRDVTLGLGVPDLVKGRRPVVPPVARMASQGGQVLLTFAVDAAGITAVQKVDGPEILMEVARQTAASWTFRRTSAERIYLEAVFTFQGDTAKAEVRAAQE